MIGVAEALVVVLALGVPLGLAAGYLGGRFDRIVGWLTDLTFSMPALIIILVVVVDLPAEHARGDGRRSAFLVGAGLTRVVRSATLPVREELYVAAARVSGLSRPYIIARHVLPRIAGVVIVQASLFAAGALLVTAGLAFLGLIVTAPAPSWGGMVGDGIRVCIAAVADLAARHRDRLTCSRSALLGDAVRDATAEAGRRPCTAPPKRRPRADAGAAA